MARAQHREVDMRIGEAAAEVGLEPSAIRYYEQQGVLPAPGRTASGYRSYGADDLDVIRFVKRARSLGIPLDDVRQIVEMRTQGEAPCQVVRQVMAREAAAMDTRIAELQTMRRELLELQARAEAIADDWPDGACVCHVVESD